MTLENAIYPRISLPLVLRMRLFLNRCIRVAFSADKITSTSASVEQKFIELITRENATISKICFSYACSIAEFDDLRQDALINIWRGMQSFRGEASQRTWIYRVTVNSCLSTIRKQSRHQHESIEKLYGLIDSDYSEKETIEQMHRIIGTLGAQEKAIIIMWLDELSYEDIANTMGLNRNTIATKIRRIKYKLIKEYEKEEKL